MSWLNIVGFETGDTSELTGTGGTNSVQSSTVRTGTYALRTNPTTTGTGYGEIKGADRATYNIATGYHRFYFRAATLPASSSEEIFSVLTRFLATKCTCRITSGGLLALYDSNGTTQLGSNGTTALSTGTWYRIEFKIGTGASAAYELKINGTVELSGTFNSTTNSGAMRLGKVTNRNGQSVDFFYDDYALRDDAYPGAGAVKIMTPDGDGYATAWTIGAGSGSKFQVVDEVPPNSATDYLVSTLTTGDTGAVSLQSSSAAGISGSINTVKSCCILRQDGASASSCKTRIRNASTNADSAAHTPNTSYLAYGNMSDVDPSDSAAWTTTDLDGTEVAVVENSAANKTRVTAIYLMVDYVAEQLLQGSTSGAASTSGNMVVTAAMAGSASGAASDSGNVVVTAAMAGSSSGTSSDSGNMVVVAAMAGSSSGSSSDSGVLTREQALQGSASGVASDSGNMVVTAAMAGSTSGVASTSGILSSGSEVLMQASVTGKSSITGSLTVEKPLQGAASGAASTSGTFTPTRSMQGSSDGSSAVSAGPLLSIAVMAGVVVAGASTSATLTVIPSSPNGMLLFGAGAPVTVPRLVPTATAVFSGPGAPPLPVAFPSFYHAMRTHQTSAPWMWMNTLWLFRVFPGTGLGNILQVIERIVPYGNILDDVVDPLVIFNTYRVSLTLTSLTGAGAIVDVFTTAPNYSPPIPPPNPPAPQPLPGAPNIGLLKPGQQILFDVVILADNDFSTADVRYVATYQVAGGGSFPFAFRIMGSRAVLFQYLPDWNENPPKIEEGYDTDVFASDQQHEQRTTTYDTLDVQHSFDVDFKVDGVRDGARLYNRLIRIRHRRAAVPFYSEPMEASADAAGSSSITVTSVGLDDLMWKSEEIVRLDTGNPEYFEARKVVSSDGITGEVVVDSPWITSVPKHQQLFFFVRYVSVASMKRRNLNDQAHVVSVVFRSWD